jgi:hypothetical protein
MKRAWKKTVLRKWKVVLDLRVEKELEASLRCSSKRNNCRSLRKKRSGVLMKRQTLISTPTKLASRMLDKRSLRTQDRR